MPRINSCASIITVLLVFLILNVASAVPLSPLPSDMDECSTSPIYTDPASYSFIVNPYTESELWFTLQMNPDGYRLGYCYETLTESWMSGLGSEQTYWQAQGPYPYKDLMIDFSPMPVGIYYGEVIYQCERWSENCYEEAILPVTYISCSHEPTDEISDGIDNDCDKSVDEKSIAVVSGNDWYLDKNGNGSWDGTSTDSLATFSVSGVTGTPVTGDWDGDGVTEIGIYDSDNGNWYLDLNGNGSWDGSSTDSQYSFGSGMTGEMPVSGDWDGDGTTEIGLYDTDDGYWYLDLNGNGSWDGSSTDSQYSFGGGLTGEIPVTGNWAGWSYPYRRTEIGLYDTDDGYWYLDRNGNGSWDGSSTDAQYSFGGMSGAIPVSGLWQ